MSTAEQIIAEHRLKYKRTPARHLADTGVAYAACAAPGCDWSYDYAAAGAEAAHAAHVVAALTNAGKTIVDLPEADEVIRHGTGETFPSWETFGGAVTVEWVAGAEISMFSGDYLLDVADARGLAARLLAAARVAEGGERRG